MIRHYLSDRLKERHRAQAEGIAIARNKGVRFGRHKNPLPENFAEVVAQQRNNELAAEEAAKKLGMPTSMYYYKAKKYGG